MLALSISTLKRGQMTLETGFLRHSWTSQPGIVRYFSGNAAKALRASDGSAARGLFSRDEPFILMGGKVSDSKTLRSELWYILQAEVGVQKWGSNHFWGIRNSNICSADVDCVRNWDSEGFPSGVPDLWTLWFLLLFWLPPHGVWWLTWVYSSPYSPALVLEYMGLPKKLYRSQYFYKHLKLNSYFPPFWRV